MRWVRLVDYSLEYIDVGMILRIPTVNAYRGDWYPESIVDLLVFNAQGFSRESATGLVAISGYKAGLINVIFPLASKPEGRFGLSKAWLLEHWREWVYPAGLVGDVWIGEPDAIDEMPDGTIPVSVE